jgi:hypothetical protein
VYRQTRGVIRRVPIREENDVATAYPITDGFAYASRTARLSLEPATETVGPADERDDAADQTRLGRSDYAVVRSGLSSNDGGGPGSGSGASPSAAPVDPPISISGSYGPVTDAAPPGFVWGDPGSLSLCSRASQDGCLSCCQTITGRYGAAALGALSAGAVSSAGAAAGIVTIPVAWAPVAIGAVVGGLILIGGFIHGTLCEKGCRTLYDRTTGDSIRTRQFQLTSAELSSSSGEQIAYRGQMTFANGNAVDVRMTREQLMAVVWGGGTVAVESSSAPTSYVSLARRPGGTGLYLRSSRDGRLVNNLRELPEFVP